MLRFATVERAKHFIGNLKKSQEASSNLKKNVSISENPKLVIENFKLKEGVRLKTKNYVLKNRNKLTEYVDDQGRRRMTKHHFETKVKGRVDLRSTNYRNYPKSQNQKLRALRNQTSTILEESDQETIRRVESLTSKASENAKNAKNMKIFFKNYTSFIKGVSDSQQIERRMRTYGKTRRQSMDSDRSFISKEKI